VRWIAAVFSSLPLLAAAVEEPAFPSWKSGELAELESTGWVAGSVLLTDAPVPDEFGRPKNETFQVEQPKPEEVAQDLAISPEIAEKFLPAYFADRPRSFLIDPQGLLSPSDYRDRLSFLNYHASDSSIDLFVYVMGGDQEIPSAVREEETIERFFSNGRPAAIVFYYLGAPQRSAVYLSPSITDAVSAAEQRRALESSVMQAFEKTQAPEQIERFLVQMSIRLYWMERMLAGESTAKNALPLVTPTVVKNRKSAVDPAKFQRIEEWVQKQAVPVGVLFFSLMTALGFSAWLRSQARYVFPEIEVEPRLGGAHAAGVGAVISFASAAVPPASQRDQVPDYLRRA
jgi:hypothetical protein